MVMATDTDEEERPFSFSLLCEVNSIRNGLTKYVELSHEIEKMLDQKESEIGTQLSETLRGTPANRHQDVHESYALDLRDYESTFRFLQREAIFLTLYNYFEHFLNKLCEWIGEEVKSRVRLGDINGRGITRALLFLDLIPEFRFDRIPNVMTTIRASNSLRNVIVHAGTVLPPDAKHPVNQFVRQHSHLSGDPGQQVSLRADFVAEFAKTLHAFFDEFDAQMQAYMDRTWRRPPLPSTPR
jgi:hypothetical protein